MSKFNEEFTALREVAEAATNVSLEVGLGSKSKEALWVALQLLSKVWEKPDSSESPGVCVDTTLIPEGVTWDVDDHGNLTVRGTDSIRGTFAAGAWQRVRFSKPEKL